MKKPFEDLLLLASCTLLLSVCWAFAAGIFGDWASAKESFAFGLIALVAFLIAQWMYVPRLGSQSDERSLTEMEPCAEILSRKECFAANVLTIANPLAEPHDFVCIPLYETERIIASGRYRLELVKSRNGEPTLVVCED